MLARRRDPVYRVRLWGGIFRGFWEIEASSLIGCEDPGFLQWLELSRRIAVTTRRCLLQISGATVMNVYSSALLSWVQFLVLDVLEPLDRPVLGVDWFRSLHFFFGSC